MTESFEQTETLDSALVEPTLIEKVRSYVLVHYGECITMEKLAAVAGMSRFGFSRKFHRECGLPPMRWLWNFRVILAARLMQIDPHQPISDLSRDCGFTSAAHFSRAFKSMYFVPPSAYRRAFLYQTRRETVPNQQVDFDGADVIDEAMSAAMINIA